MWTSCSTSRRGQTGAPRRLRAHRSQHLSIDRCFFSQPDVDEILKIEMYRQGWGPPLTRRPETGCVRGLLKT